MSELEKVRAIVNDNDSEMNNLPEREEISRPRTCGAAHNSSNSSSSKTSTPKLDDEEKMKQRAELLYPTMKENKNLENDDKKIDNTNFSSETKLKTRLFITQKEGFDANAYKDTGGVWTIGYGHTKNVKQGDVVTRAQAEELFWEDFKEHVIPLEKVKVPLSENQKSHWLALFSMLVLLHLKIQLC